MSTLLIGAIGLAGTGKSTTLSLLAECLYADGLSARAFMCDSELILNGVEHTKFRVLAAGSLLYKTLPAENQIVLVDNINRDYIERLLALNIILINVIRNQYEGRSTIHQLPTPSEYWLRGIKPDFHITSFEESLKLLSFDVKLLYNQIKQTEKWKNYERDTKNLRCGT